MALPFQTPVRRLAPVAAVAIVAVLGLSACGGGDDSTTTTTPSTAAASTTTPPSTAPTTSTTVPERTTVVVSYAGGVVDSPKEVEVKLGDQVVIRATSDVAEEIHVHTYDKKLDLAPGVPAELTFKADIPGVHEVELEKAHKQLFRLRVQ